MRLTSGIQRRLSLRGGGGPDDYDYDYPQRMPYWTKLYNETGPVRVRLIPGDNEPHFVARKEGYPDIQIRNGTNDFRNLEKLGWEIMDLEARHYEEGITGA